MFSPLRSAGSYLLSLVLLSGSAAPAFAGYIPLGAGQYLTPTLANDEAVVFPASSWENVSAFEFQVVSAGFRNADGNIDFFYQITRSANSNLPGSLSFSLKNFGGDWNRSMQEVEVGFRTDGGSFPRLPNFPQFPGFVDGAIAPLGISRSADGDVITFDFGNLLVPGSTSMMFVISTHQPNYSAGPIFTNVDGIEHIQTLAITMPHFRTPDASSSAALLFGTLVVLIAFRIRGVGSRGLAFNIKR